MTTATPTRSRSRRTSGAVREARVGDLRGRPARTAPFLRLVPSRTTSCTAAGTGYASRTTLTTAGGGSVAVRATPAGSAGNWRPYEALSRSSGPRRPRHVGHRLQGQGRGQRPRHPLRECQGRHEVAPRLFRGLGHEGSGTRPNDSEKRGVSRLLQLFPGRRPAPLVFSPRNPK